MSDKPAISDARIRELAGVGVEIVGHEPRQQQIPSDRRDKKGERAYRSQTKSQPKQPLKGDTIMEHVSEHKTRNANTIEHEDPVAYNMRDTNEKVTILCDTVGAIGAVLKEVTENVVTREQAREIANRAAILETGNAAIWGALQGIDPKTNLATPANGMAFQTKSLYDDSVEAKTWQAQAKKSGVTLALNFLGTTAAVFTLGLLFSAKVMPPPAIDTALPGVPLKK